MFFPADLMETGPVLSSWKSPESGHETVGSLQLSGRDPALIPGRIPSRTTRAQALCQLFVIDVHMDGKTAALLVPMQPGSVPITDEGDTGNEYCIPFIFQRYCIGSATYPDRYSRGGTSMHITVYNRINAVLKLILPLFIKKDACERSIGLNES